MYYFIRTVLGLGIILATVLVTKKACRFARVVKTVALLGAIILTVGIYSLPFENMLFSFSSATSVYRYLEPFGGDPYVIEGKNSALAVNQNGISHSYVVVPKAEEGWELPSTALLSGQRAWYHAQYHDDFRIETVSMLGTGEYYVCVTPSDGDVARVSDSRDSIFMDAASPSGEHRYYAYITSGDDYFVTVATDFISATGETVEVRLLL